MKRALLIPLIVLLLVMTACGPAGNKPAAAPAESGKKAAAPEKATEEASGSSEAASEGQETFDQDTGNWSDPLVVTSQAQGHDPRVKITSGAGVMNFAISDKETYVYSFYTKGLDGAATIEADFQNKGAHNTGIALVCKANEEQTSWFEARVSGGDNQYKFFKYDKKLKEEQDKNPYVLLGKGRMQVDQYSPMKRTHIVFTCSDGELSIDVNKGKVKASQPLEEDIEGSLFGVGVLTADLMPGNLDFETVTIR